LFLSPYVLIICDLRPRAGRKIDTKLKNFERYSYIDMLIIYTGIKGKIGTDKQFKYFVGIGPDISYWLSAKGTLYNSDLEENNIEEVSYKAVFKKSVM